MAKAGIGLQGLSFYRGGRRRPSGHLLHWATSPKLGSLRSIPSTVQLHFRELLPHNKGCGYAMFNNFKGLRLYGVQTLPGIGRPAGPGPIPANDWYADYVDNLLANQQNPTNPTGGNWNSPSMGFSSTN